MKLDGGGSERRLVAWWDTASDQDRQSIADALFAVMDGTWEQDYHHYDDVTRKLQYIVEVHSDLIMVIRFAQEYPGVFILIYVGDPDGR